MELLYDGVSLGEKAGGGHDLEQGRWNQYRKNRESSLIEQIRVAIGTMWLIASFLLTIRFADRWVCFLSSMLLRWRERDTNGSVPGFLVPLPTIMRLVLRSRTDIGVSRTCRISGALTRHISPSRTNQLRLVSFLQVAELHLRRCCRDTGLDTRQTLREANIRTSLRESR